ncbi:hypothetical protein GO755_20615 [Spirosoma sp. HMF4905]|uniref:Uncharacterized protein n=1 Tax=Spirosoma arboris TaxID=2682092 RepID=A0A7K1SF61_9BACT|nr:hypothetical protein [Spirosoma arboris]MVM32460.1 hypothetical protein [Spirosoma arboris]
MEDNNKVEPDYLKGFNEGYVIAQSVPDLAEQLVKVQTDSQRMAGFKAGRDQYVTERMREHLPSWLKADRSIKEQESPSKSKDRDIEPEK